MVDRMQFTFVAISLFFAANIEAFGGEAGGLKRPMFDSFSSRHRCFQFRTQSQCEDAGGCTWAYEINQCLPARPGHSATPSWTMAK